MNKKSESALLLLIFLAPYVFRFLLGLRDKYAKKMNPLHNKKSAHKPSDSAYEAGEVLTQKSSMRTKQMPRPLSDTVCGAKQNPPAGNVSPANSSSSQRSISANNAIHARSKIEGKTNYSKSCGRKKTSLLTKTSIANGGIYKSSVRSTSNSAASSVSARNRYRDCILLLNPKFNKLGVKI